MHLSGGWRTPPWKEWAQHGGRAAWVPALPLAFISYSSYLQCLQSLGIFNLYWFFVMNLQ